MNRFQCKWHHTWCPTWTVSNFVFTLTASFTLGCGHGSLKSLGDFSEDTKCGFLLHGCFPVLNHFVCDFDGVRSLLRFLWSGLILIVLFIIITSLLIAKHTHFINVRSVHYCCARSQFTSSADGNVWYFASSSSSELSSSLKFRSDLSFCCKNLKNSGSLLFNLESCSLCSEALPFFLPSLEEHSKSSLSWRALISLHFHLLTVTPWKGKGKLGKILTVLRPQASALSSCWFWVHSEC